MDSNKRPIAIRQFILVAVLCVLGAPLACFADTMQAAAATDGTLSLTQVSTLISGSHTNVNSFQVPFAGTLTVSLTDLAWPDPFAVLSLALTDSHATLGRLTAPGVLTFEVSTPGEFFAFVFGQSQGALNIGLYSMHVSLSPAVAAVPLPAAIWLFFAGIAGLVPFRRKAR